MFSGWQVTGIYIKNWTDGLEEMMENEKDLL